LILFAHRPSDRRGAALSRVALMGFANLLRAGRSSPQGHSAGVRALGAEVTTVSRPIDGASAAAGSVMRADRLILFAHRPSDRRGCFVSAGEFRPRALNACSSGWGHA